MSDDTYNILAQLPSMSWRGIILPVVERTHTFQFETAPHKIIYRDGVATEMLGEQGRVFHYTIPMRESVTSVKEGLKYLFTKGFRELYRAYRDPRPGMLVDPLHGAILCTPASWEDHLESMKLDGADVRLSFTEYTPIGQKIQDDPPTIRSLFEITTAMDAAVVAAPWDAQQQSPPPTTDPLSLAAGLLNQGNATRRRMNAKVLAVAARMGKVENAAAEAQANAPDSKSAAIFNGIRLQARKGRLDATRVANAPPRDKASTLIQITTDTVKTIPQMAADAGMTIEEFLQVNPGLGRLPYVPANTRVFKKSANAY